ncbi:MAG: restriction endonuclease subunit S [Actinomyces sp.]|nr:restriction endonuclease subunit S [Actinomyces sp.]
MSRLAELIEQLCPDGVEYKPLGELLVYQQPTPFLVSSKDYDPSYPTPVLTAGATFLLGYSSETHGVYAASTDDPVIIFDDFTTASKWVDFPFKLKSSAAKILTAADPSVADIRFLYFLMQTIKYQVGSHARHWIAVYSKMPVCCPPLEVQREIVRILDQFTTLEAELEAELEARRAQFEHYRNHLLSYDSLAARGPVSWIPLREFGVWSGGGTPSKSRDDYWDEGNIPWITPKDMRSSKIQNSMMNVTDRAVRESNVKLIEAPSIALVVRSSILQHTFPVAQIDVDATFNQDMKTLVVDSDRFERRYIYYALSANGQEILRQTSKQGGSVNSLVVPRLMDYEIPVPALDEQQRIADLLDRFDALVNDITSGLPAEIAARRAQYEHYRDRLLSFPEKRVSDRDAS